MIGIQSHREHLHHFVPEVIDYLYRNPTRLWLCERPRGVAVKRIPGFPIDLGLEGGLERFVRVVRAEKVCLANEEATLVCGGINRIGADEAG